MSSGFFSARSHIPRAIAYTYTLLTPPAQSPVTLTEAKDYLKVTGTDDDTLIQLIIDSATAFAEKYTKRDFITRTWTTFRDSFNSVTIELRRSPLQTVDRFEYLVDTVLTAVPSSTFYNTLEADYSRIALINNETWPTDADFRLQAIEVDFTTGFGNSCADIPDDLRNALLAHIALLYENRGDCFDCGCIVPKTIAATIPPSSLGIYNQYRILEMKVGIA